MGSIKEVWAMIQVDHLSAEIDGLPILKSVDLHLAPGEIYGLLGPNGAGKSTTISVLVGLRRASGGRVRVLGHDPGGHALEIRRGIGVMPERAGFYEWMTADDYLRWYAGLYGRALGDPERRTLFEKVGLSMVRDRLIGTYSRGMKQRLALARALMVRPKLLILDEPTNGLDPQGRREIHDLVSAVAAEGAGVLLSTHLLDDVDRLCTRIGIIDRGRTRCDGPLGELLSPHGAGRRYRLRLETAPNPSDLPPGFSPPVRKGEWWHLRIPSGATGAPADWWQELLRRGWRILEIRSEVLGLEALYLESVAHIPELEKNG